MAKEYGRSTRVASEMQKELALIIQREIADSRLGFITINEVVISKDLAIAKIYFTVFNADEISKRNHVKWLNELVPMIRHLLAKKMRLRHISELRFYYDDSFDTGMRVAELLSEDLQKSPKAQDTSEEK
jgi:ribosome-binding factor A